MDTGGSQAAALPIHGADNTQAASALGAGPHPTALDPPRHGT